MLCFSASNMLFSQEKVTVKPGKTIQDYFTKAETYLYPDFKNGTVLFKDGKIATAKMNYNILMGQILFIQPPKDTLAIANPSDIFILTIQSDTFYFSKGYHLLLATGFGRYLTKKQFLKYEDTRKGGAYGTTSSLSATTTMSSYSDNHHQTTNLVSNQEFVVSKRSEFYIADSKGRYRILTYQNVMKLYPKHKEVIQKFLSSEKIDFTKQEDAVKLFGFLMRCI